jgi:formate/nitrite transporter FocA (FNT family)
MNLPNLTWSRFFIDNLIPVTLGNIIGGVVFVGFAYWFAYLKGEKVERC